PWTGASWSSRPSPAWYTGRRGWPCGARWRGSPSFLATGTSTESRCATWGLPTADGPPTTVLNQRWGAGITADARSAAGYALPPLTGLSPAARRRPVRDGWGPPVPTVG